MKEGSFPFFAGRARYPEVKSCQDQGERPA